MRRWLALTLHACTTGLDNLEPEHVEILLRILHAATLEGEDAQEGPYQLAANSSAPVAEAFTQNSERWLAVLKKIELHVYVALADDELCDNIVIVSLRRACMQAGTALARRRRMPAPELLRPSASPRVLPQVLTKWIRALGDRALLTFATLNKSLKLIFAADPSPDACQDGKHSSPMPSVEPDSPYVSRPTMVLRVAVRLVGLPLVLGGGGIGIQLARCRWRSRRALT